MNHMPSSKDSNPLLSHMPKYGAEAFIIRRTKMKRPKNEFLALNFESLFSDVSTLLFYLLGGFWNFMICV